MKIAIIIPMAEEREYYLEHFQLEAKERIGAVEFEHFTHGSNDIYLGLSGIGKVQAAMALTSLLATTKIDLIFLTGSAGSLQENVRVNDLVVADAFAYHDVNAVNAGPYVIGQIPQEPAIYSLANDYREQFVSFLHDEQIAFQSGLIVTGDTFVSTNALKEAIKANFPTALGVEMEGAAMAQVASHFAVPLIGLRAISDNGDDNADFDFDQFVRRVGKTAAQTISKFLDTDIL
ncbi:nucleoside phosphorylase [Amylolactobacillus amylotrophicus DSM 20534]|uniref:adenosylhomocysteine nucleosidase n=3 Tax=Amylolactobacillus TaxID=2767876 RepID=A0A0R1YJT1_9LACO|nr:MULTISPECIES: 5'-methylthioadenosine/adenosylhomocysteine nucleosidase [Amylolactobacillus]APT19113.1 5'-methylthioadenosine/S-adenosylhomocysteine nucleosidase [Amylolactobacillus amylophilus DSM 20533 = JCM 1125]KRK38621.1 nucleoside phosphorylase [Amylolactobacillus amylotrophicus DSM 20534]KRM42736.1 nucleoside phosphorylase [Amylolactobacillus amylophilus DSM 20533 = JCM 1125]GED79599.1 5'-methylthioadenosine/S-adenosylhomocysteine nucleosidase [Amylolactobacillus amylophilus]